MAGATAAVTTVVEKLDVLQNERYKLSRRVRRDIAAIADELRAAQEAVATTTAAEAQHDLHKAPSSNAAGFSELGSTIAAVRGLIDMLEDLEPRSAAGYCSSKLREVCYIVEDIVDEFTAYVDPPPAATRRRVVGGGLYRSAMKWMAMALTRRTVAIECGQLKRHAVKKYEDLGRLMNHIRFVPSSVPAVQDLPPPHRCLPPELDASPTNFNVGDQRDRVAELLLLGESAPPLVAVTIAGPAGIGKTTLAGEVCRMARTFFDCFVWVSTSPNSSYKNIFTDILRQIEDPCEPGSEGRMGESDLMKKIERSLEHKRYLVVIDNEPVSTARNIINSTLPRNSPGSRVIVTTRDYLVEELAEGCPLWRCHTYYKPYLIDSHDYGRGDSARLLFHKRVFGSTGSCPPDLVDVADKILCKCSGMPLAITLVSGLLANRPFARTVWEDVYKFIAASTPDSDGGKRNLVLLCYHGLPNYLKTCLLYLNIFPENYRINRDRVVRSWIAEGFVFEKHGRTLEEEGERYFSDLVQRGMIQPAGGCYNGNPEAFMIHGFVLDLIRSKLVRDNFVTLLLDKGTPVVSKPAHKKVRRLSITSEDHDIPKSMAMSDIRALYVFTGFIPKLRFKKLVFLRVLDLEGCKDLKNHDIEEIVGLKHLRYLSIKDTPISELPDQIGQLQHLTTLDVRGTEVQAMPTSIVQLRNLTNLLCDKMRFQECIGKMTSISCLSQFDIFQSEIRAVEELGNLSELKKLALWWFPDADSLNTGRHYKLAVSFYRLKKLQSLYIDGSNSSVDFLDHLHHPLEQMRRIQLSRSCYLSRIPAWFNSLPRLAYVCTSVKEIKNEDLQLLSQIPSLRHLSLSSKVLPTEKLVIRSKGFPVLQKFQLDYVRADLTFEPHAMQKVEELLLSVHVLPEETYGFAISIDQFMCLEGIDIIINGEGAAASQLFEATNFAIRNAAEEHPNRPMVSVIAARKVDYAAKCTEKKRGLENKNGGSSY